MKKLLLLSLVFILLPSAFILGNDPEVRIYKKVGDRELAVHIFKPEKQDAPSPAVVWYHGGGWNPRGRAGQFFEHGKILAGLGVVSVSVDYRGYEGTAQNRDISNCIADAKSAFRWVKAHAKELNIDTTRIAVGGGSAGGHLAAAVATLPGYDDPKDDLSIEINPSLQLLFNPAVDPSKVTGDGYSPLHTVKKGISPAVIFHGKADTTVPITQAYDYQRAMDKVGSECTLFAYAGQSHGFFNHRPGSMPHYYKTVGDMLVYLEKHGYFSK
ncbi:alpha/beta hydrolase [Opitutia bacterium ISCC 51]|nr:alpha/beta hydrolase [Opitutae bacterium ISCC 51]QXD26899.1 alpha/beta hydrolase [Opitutae bacterium ISCC 52]